MEIRADSTLTINPEARGCTLGLLLTDPTNTQWDLVIEAGVGHAFGRVGIFRTAAPSAGSGFTRWIGFVHAPGVTAWRVTARVVGVLPNATADLELCISNQSPPIGLQANGAFAAVIP